MAIQLDIKLLKKIFFCSCRSNGFDFTSFSLTTNGSIDLFVFQKFTTPFVVSEAVGAIESIRTAKIG